MAIARTLSRFLGSGVISVALTLGLVAAPAAAGDSDVSWGKSGIGVWRYDEGAGVWLDIPGAVAEDPNNYKFEYLCLDEAKNNFDVACLGGAVRCDQAPEGRPVRWYASLRVFSPPIWSALRPDRCVYSEKPEDVLGKIAAEIRAKFQQLPVSPGALIIQPSPHTLKGAETNFYAEAAKQAFEIDMFGQKVAVTATPVQYTWSYGDGTALGPTPAAGGPLPQERWGEKTATSHAYAETGDFAVVLTTHFQGTYSVNGGPPLPIPGQGQFSSPPQTVSVWRSITRNYADDCLRNPQGQGCPGAPSP